MALNSLICADVPLRSCSLTHLAATPMIRENNGSQVLLIRLLLLLIVVVAVEEAKKN